MSFFQGMLQWMRGQAVAETRTREAAELVFRPSAAPVFVCTVSHEPLANLIPLLQHEVAGARALLLVSPKMQDKARQMQAFLKGRGIGSAELPLDDSDILALRRSVNEARAWLDSNAADARWMLNLTGGTKLMSRELERALQDAPNTIAIYADTPRGRVDILGAATSEPYRNVLDVDGYLRAQGFSSTWVLSDQSWYQKAVEELSPAVAVMRDIAAGNFTDRDAQKTADLMAALNAAAQQVINSPKLGMLRNKEDLAYVPTGSRGGDLFKQLAVLYPWPVAERQPGKQPATGGKELVSLPGPDASVMKKLQEVGLIQKSPHSSARYAFPDTRAAKIVGGGWLEWCVMQVARGLGFDAAHVKHSQNVRWLGSTGGKPTTNELDLVIVHNARMLIVECKTIRVAGQQHKMSDAIYKLDHLRQYVGSTRSHALLVSANPVTPHERQRLRNIGGDVHYCAGRDLQRLQEFMTLWRDNRAHEWQPGEGSIARKQSRKTGQGGKGTARSAASKHPSQGAAKQAAAATEA